MLTDASWGTTDTEAKELAVMACMPPFPSGTVTTVTPVVNDLRPFLNSSGFTIERNLPTQN
jgi:hypothetical protein